MKWKGRINWRKEVQDSDGEKGKQGRFMKCDIEREA
jgi:hypothetical protein